MPVRLSGPMTINAVIIGCFAWLAATAAFGQDRFPSKPVRMVVPWPPGGPPDVMARAAATKMTEAWGKPVIVENRAGATGTIGTYGVVKAVPDGYTLLVTSNQPMVMAPALFKTPYDPAKDLMPMVIFGQGTEVLVAGAPLGIRSLSELIALAKAKPGTLSYATSGVGSIGHLCGELLKQMAGIDLLHVPYKSAEGATSSVLSGDVSLNCGTIQQTARHIKEGRLVALGTSGPQRSQFLPDVPTIAAQGLPGFALNAWYGAFAPLKTPRPLVELLREKLRAALQDPLVRQVLDGLGTERLWEVDDEVTSHIESDLARYRKVVQFAHITVE